MKNKLTITVLLMIAVFAITASSCKKKKDPRVPPDLTFKSDAGFTSADKTVGLGDTVKVGLVATRTEDKLNTFNVSYSYDGAAQATKTNENIFNAEEEGFTREIPIIARNVAGSEKWIFTVTDLDGNITTKSITLTVQ